MPDAPILEKTDNVAIFNLFKVAISNDPTSPPAGLKRFIDFESGLRPKPITRERIIRKLRRVGNAKAQNSVSEQSPWYRAIHRPREAAHNGGRLRKDSPST